MGILDVIAKAPTKLILARKEMPHFTHISGLFRDSTKYARSFSRRMCQKKRRRIAYAPDDKLDDPGYDSAGG